MAVGCENLPINNVDARTPIERRKGDCQRSLRKTINGELRFATKSVFCEALFESQERFWIYRLGAVEGRTPRTEVEALDIFVSNFSYTEFVREIWRSGNRAAVLVERPQPSFRTCEKCQRRYHANRRTEMQQCEPGTDQAHIVIKRKPADAHIL